MLMRLLRYRMDHSGNALKYVNCSVCGPITLITNKQESSRKKCGPAPFELGRTVLMPQDQGQINRLMLCLKM